MTTITSTVKAFTSAQVYESIDLTDIATSINKLLQLPQFRDLLLALVNGEAFSDALGVEFESADAVAGLSACRQLRSSLNLSLGSFWGLLEKVLTAFDGAPIWAEFARAVQSSEFSQERLITQLRQGPNKSFYQELEAQLIEVEPHAIYPTSSYRESSAHVVSTADDHLIEAVVGTRTFSSIRLVDNVLDSENLTLRDIYAPLGRCVCVIDQNIEQYYGEQIEHYFKFHNVKLDKMVHRAMEVDKGIRTVENMLGEFKMLGVSRDEPVLIIGGGVLTDTAGLACALYHRNTPYIMLSTSIVAGIDAGPSPRTCCDGFGYKNLFGSYHPPVMSITDRYFFKTLRQGWLRHGISEIIKMAVVKDAELFEDLENAGPELVTTRFGTLDCQPQDPINALSQKILGGALRSYVSAEYGNLYETHQCRPHAYGHTWSPGFEIEAGLLHGHAVSIGMGFGAYVSYRTGWINSETLHRILRLISSFGLSLWHDILHNGETLWASQEKIFQKRGRNLVAPLPKGDIGNCGYLNEMSREDLFAAIDEYRDVCAEYPRLGLGIEPLCSDVGLEDPSTVAHHASGPVPETAQDEVLSSV
ncbi:MAG: sedoheptulose 7-phosphate cyclase [Cyanobacteria bacterium P01_F01_bin.42]